MKVTWNGGLYKKETHTGHGDTRHVLETILKPYFKTASFNDEGLNEPFVFNSYCYHSAQPNNYGKTVEIPDRSERYGDTFWARSNGLPTSRGSSPNIRLLVGDRYAGLLCPETQTLWATGWTHMEEYRTMTRHIINFLAEQGFLRILPPPPKKKRAKKEKPAFAITIGGDPEFELVDNGGVVVNASNYNCFHISEEFGNVGVDGSGYQVELRPSPGEPEVVVTNIRKLLEEFNLYHGDEFRLAASSSKYPCGGHIHIGVEPKPDNTYYKKLSNVLDEFVGKNTIKLNGPARELGNERNECSYGRIGDYRHQEHGMEYRTPPSAIWKNPKLTGIVLKLTYNLAVNLANNLSLEFSTPVGKETLVTVGGLCDEEADIYLQECSKPAPMNTECLLAAWHIERIGPKPKIRVVYRDSWYSGVREIINRELAKIVVSSPINLTFYGLREDRGDVYTFEVPGCKTITHPKEGYQSTDFGFSVWFRNGNTSSARITEIANIVGRMVVAQQGVVGE